MEETYPLPRLMLLAEDDTENFEETPNDDKAVLSNEDRCTMKAVEHTIKYVDDFKFPLKIIPLRYISLNLPDNVLVARDRLEQQCKSLQNKRDRAMKYHKKMRD